MGEYNTIKIILDLLEEGDLVYFKMLPAAGLMEDCALTAQVISDAPYSKVEYIDLTVGAHNKPFDWKSSETVMLLEKYVERELMQYSCIHILRDGKILRISTRRMGTDWTVEKAFR